MRRGPIIAALISAAMLPPVVDSGGGDPRVPWKRLSYRASKLLVHASTEVVLERMPAGAAADLLLTPTRGCGLSPLSDEVVLVMIRARGLGTIAETRVLVDPTDGACLQRIQVDTGRRPRYKAYRFGPDGVTVLRRHPGAGEGDLRPDRWSELAETFQPYPEGLPKGVRPSEPSALFFLLSSADLVAPGDRVVIPMYTKSSLLDVELTAVAAASTEVDYRLVSEDRERRVEGRRDLLRVRLAARRSAAGGGSDAEADLSFLGLEGDLELRLDPELGVPVEIRGRVPVVGSLVVRLDRIEMASPAPSPSAEPVPPRTPPPPPAPCPRGTP